MSFDKQRRARQQFDVKKVFSEHHSKTEQTKKRGKGSISYSCTFKFVVGVERFLKLAI